MSRSYLIYLYPILRMVLLYHSVLFDAQQCFSCTYCTCMHICGTIEGNGSYVGKIQVWFFSINHLMSIQNATDWSKLHLNRSSCCRDMTNYLMFKNRMEHRNLSLLLVSNSKSIFLTSDSFPLIMSYFFILICLFVFFWQVSYFFTSHSHAWCWKNYTIRKPGYTTPLSWQNMPLRSLKWSPRSLGKNC